MENYPDGAVAVVGMACRFPGADSVNDFWEILKTGRSVDCGLPNERIPLANHWRNPHGMKFKGSFLDNIDAFDHKFFNITSREAASMDPQQRLLLEVSYQALESSGYFGHLDWDREVGCYIGGFSSDYNDNIASQPVNAYSALGSLKGFQSGRISHHFQWTGPSIMYDTVCSSSGVAIDAACKALIAGDCSSAIAGGVSVFTSPFMYQNLAGASFLSPDGKIKPFDIKADGYARAEGVGIVVLKPLSVAIKSGDPIFGVIRSSIVRQSTSPHITVPQSESQATLYRRLLDRAQISPDEVTYIEAHGTGTRIGDTPEYEGIKAVFGGKGRQNMLHFASLKGNIGHAEGASGVASLIKTLLMIEHSEIPPQANFETINPKINLEGSKIAIPLSLLPWQSEPHIALVNNFGAAGSLSALIVQEPPSDRPVLLSQRPEFPVCLAAKSHESLECYYRQLDGYIACLTTPVPQAVLANLCFTISRRSNYTLPIRRSFTVSSIEELSHELQLTPSVSRSANGLVRVELPKPVILVFGGQASSQVQISIDLYSTSPVFSSHFDQCNETLASLGIPIINPHVPNDNESNDPMALQTTQFAIQYSCARTWIDCGLRVDCILGHSLGQLVALVVSGCLSLTDGLRFLCGRASLISSRWGKDKGIMTHLNASTDTVDLLISRLKELEPRNELEIACHNGPHSHVLVGTSQESQALETILQTEFRETKYKRLDVTHGFHSKLTEPILNELRTLALSLTFNKQSIPIEMCVENSTQELPTPAGLVDHTRQPVYFSHAVQRIEARFGACTWIEAGAGSSVINMVQSASNQAKEHAHNFHAVKLDGRAQDSLASTIKNLWIQGYGVVYWGFGPSRTPGLRLVQIPPFQFDHSRHWIELKERVIGAHDHVAMPARNSQADHLDILIKSHGRIESTKETVFFLNSKSPKWCTLLEGHLVQGTPVCPASLYLTLVMEAIRKSDQTTQPSLATRVDSFHMRNSIGLCETGQTTLKLIRNGKNLAWRFLFEKGDASHTSTLAAEGQVTLVPEEEQSKEFSRATRLLDVYRKVEEADNLNKLHGPVVYNLLSGMVHFGPEYHRLDNVSLDKRTVRADLLPAKNIDIAPHAVTFSTTLDACLQAAPLHISSLGIHSNPDEAILCVSIESVQFSTHFVSGKPDRSWSLISHLCSNEKTNYHYDIFALDPITGEVALIMNNVRISRLPSSLISSNASLHCRDPGKSHVQQSRSSLNCDKNSQNPRSQDSEPIKFDFLHSKQPSYHDIKRLLSSVTDFPAQCIMDSTELLELGIDSLAMSEICINIKEAFSIPIRLVELATIQSVGDLCDLVKSKSAISMDQIRSHDLVHSFENETTYNKEREEPVTLSRVRKFLNKYIEVPAFFDPSTQLGNLGVDSLLCIELLSDINGPNTPLENNRLSPQTTIHELCGFLFGESTYHQSTPSREPSLETDGKNLANYEAAGSQEVAWTTAPQELLDQSQRLFQSLSTESGSQSFWHEVYPDQARLTEAYILNAFERMGVHVRRLQSGERLPDISVLQRYEKLKVVLLEILREGGLVDYDGMHYIRSDKTTEIPIASELASEFARRHPRFTLENNLLQIIGPHLDSFLLGQEEPLQYLFGNAETRLLLEEVYSTCPMFLVMNKLLARFIEQTSSAFEACRPIRILEIGAGTGGTTSHIVQSLSEKGIPFQYTFTDMSPSLVNFGRRKFAKYESHMEFSVFDVEKPPSSEMISSFDIVISTLCIHATRDLARSLRHINQVLQPHGFVALAEFTKRIPWLDCVFGLLDGWWLFEDDRSHALAPAPFWERSMLAAGFKQAISTSDRSLESKTSRVLVGFKSQHAIRTPRGIPVKPTDLEHETICFDHRSIHLRADIYYPVDVSVLAPRKWPIALVIHGGGHVMMSRKDIPSKQILWLLEHGILPISIDYRLCPEQSILDGALSDVRTAFVWARKELQCLNLRHHNIQIDAERIGIVGWSSGGNLALTLGWTPKSIGVRPPDAILAFYSPCDYEDDYWKTPQPAVFAPQEFEMNSENSLLTAVQKHPITSYAATCSETSPLSWIHPSDSRARIYWHMVKNGQTLPVLFKGLPTPGSTSVDMAETLKNMPQPLSEDVQKFSPYAHMKDGQHTVPTFFVHGKSDVFVPWQQSKRAYDLLCEKGVPTGISLPEGEAHLFDLEYDPTGVKWHACEKAYIFLQEHLQL
ncbi:Acyl transferase/acyl hydrolase/lysophospholipase [Penicillium italicum]|uniref:Acyl transferase/acyl hydrolase/lysophospholipase n=1 Tax=Penicillium italicum TaxID=40296 RepID=A0A0A2L5D6_PENIT|nr:Acyl transferase/acyl hydrolase/lysophospholipase [Penicillium italicum]